MESWRAELYHHGILGQKWGRRNGPPYPLKAGDHSAREKKAGWRKSLNGGSRKSKPASKQGGSSASQPRKKTPMTNEQKKAKIRKAVLIAGGITLAAAAAYVAHDKYVHEYVDQILKEGTEFKRVTMSEDIIPNRAFYAARSKADATKYIGLYGKQQRDAAKRSNDYLREEQKKVFTAICL